jgi:hypothetical protein
MLFYELVGSIPLVLDLRIAHNRHGSSSDPNKRPSNDISSYLSLIVRLGVYTLNLCSFHFCRLIGKLTDFYRFWSTTCGIQPLPFSPLDVLRTAQVHSGPHPHTFKPPSTQHRHSYMSILFKALTLVLSLHNKTNIHHDILSLKCSFNNTVFIERNRFQTCTYYQVRFILKNTVIHGLSYTRKCISLV